MSIRFRVLGGPTSDNGLYVEVDTGQSISRLLFDCGEGVPTAVPFGDLIQLDHLFQSHGHMDHMAGFATLLRRVYSGAGSRPVIWGPEGTAVLMQHQMRGFLWNLVADATDAFRLVDVLPSEVRTVESRLAEAYATRYDVATVPREPVLYRGRGFDVEAADMDHGSVSLAYIVREHTRTNVDAAAMLAMGLKPGPWMKDLKDGQDGALMVEVAGTLVSMDTLREQLLIRAPGGSVAYCTDFLLDEAAMERLLPALRGVDTLVCEAQYRHEDLPLAIANRHMTSVQVATLAKEAGVGELILIHVSGRYTAAERQLLLEEAQAVFPARYPDGWSQGTGHG